MTQKLFIGLGGFIAVGFIAFAMMFLVSGNKKVEASYFNGTIIGAATTSTAVAVTSSTRLVATTTGTGDTSYTRVYSVICNPNANPVFISLNNDKAASKTSATYVIAAAAGYNVCYEITDRNMYQGSITASSTNETSTTLNVASYVY